MNNETKFFTIKNKKHPLILDGKFNPELNQMLCKEIDFQLTTDFGSTITGSGTLVFGVGGNTNSIIIIIDDREMNRKCDMRFNVTTINYGFRKFKLEAKEKC